jgi:beta-1,4-mannosyl-glycoprotein beta-1,4-N-acetylglucosaminyltransferase
MMRRRDALLPQQNDGGTNPAGGGGEAKDKLGDAAERFRLRQVLRGLHDRRRGLAISCGALALLALLFPALFGTTLLGFLRHYSRPIWDTPDDPWRHVIVQRGWREGESAKENCERYGLRARASGPLKLIDAFVFGTELDLLEIRLEELKGVVDRHILVESTVTFTGKPKAAAFSASLGLKDGASLPQSRPKESATRDSKEANSAPLSGPFARFADRIEHVVLNADEFNRNDRTTMMQRENWSRYAMSLYGISRLLASGFISAEGPGYLMLVSDVDEIPRAEVLRAVKECEGWPEDPIHLEMTRWLYSFEWAGDPTFAAAVWQRNKTANSDPLSHRRRSDTLFADAGWHCTFCFEYLDQFARKMDAYAHADRGDSLHRSLDHIQDVVCSGTNLYGDYMDPGFTLADTLRLAQPAPRRSTTVGLPEYVLANQDRFRYLIPGNCLRARSEVERSRAD